MYKVRGDGPGVHFNIGLSDEEKADLDSISLEALMAKHKTSNSKRKLNIAFGAPSPTHLDP
jgi:hypothetical protein